MGHSPSSTLDRLKGILDCLFWMVSWGISNYSIIGQRQLCNMIGELLNTKHWFVVIISIQHCGILGLNLNVVVPTRCSN